MGDRRGLILTKSTANDTMDFEFDTCLWDEIQDMPGEIFDIEEWQQQADEDVTVS